MKNKKNLSGIHAILLAAMLSACFIACSNDDEDDFGHHAKYPFAGKNYVYQWTLQNTSSDFQYVIHFATDSTFTLTPLRVADGETMSKPREGLYEMATDGTISFSGVSSYPTGIKGQKITLYRGRFKTDEQKTLEVYRYLHFNTGNSRTDWIDFVLK